MGAWPPHGYTAMLEAERAIAAGVKHKQVIISADRKIVVSQRKKTK
jgi:hypothetical protein